MAADPSRTRVDKLILHHAVTPTWENRSKADLAKWFSDNGYVRGYDSNASRWSGLINPFTGGRSYAQAHVVGQRVNDSTPDATASERAAGFRVFAVVKDIYGQITWGAGNWPVNCSAINMEILGDYRNYPLRTGDMKVIADFWRPQDQKMGGTTNLYGHQQVTQTATACPSRILESIGAIINHINNPPKPVETPKPAEPAKPAQNPYTRLEKPLDLVANKQPTNAYDLSKKTWDELGKAIVKQLPKDAPFVAVGKYKHPLGGVYFMTAFSFGNADKTGKPDHTFGVNTVDLSPKPSAPAEQPAPAEEPPKSSGPVEVPVTVIPSDPNKWMLSFEAAADSYIAKESAVIKDLTGAEPDKQLVKGMSVDVAGHFVKDDHLYYRTVKSVELGQWYGIPTELLVEDDSAFVVGDEEKHVIEELSFKDKVIRLAAWIVGWFQSLGKKKDK